MIKTNNRLGTNNTTPTKIIITQKGASLARAGKRRTEMNPSENQDLLILKSLISQSAENPQNRKYSKALSGFIKGLFEKDEYLKDQLSSDKTKVYKTLKENMMFLLIIEQTINKILVNFINFASISNNKEAFTQLYKARILVNQELDMALDSNITVVFQKLFNLLFNKNFNVSTEAYLLLNSLIKARQPSLTSESLKSIIESLLLNWKGYIDSVTILRVISALKAMANENYFSDPDSNNAWNINKILGLVISLFKINTNIDLWLKPQELQQQMLKLILIFFKQGFYPKLEHARQIFVWTSDLLKIEDREIQKNASNLMTLILKRDVYIFQDPTVNSVIPQVTSLFKAGNHSLLDVLYAMALQNYEISKSTIRHAIKLLNNKYDDEIRQKALLFIDYLIYPRQINGATAYYIEDPIIRLHLTKEILRQMPSILDSKNPKLLTTALFCLKYSIKSTYYSPEIMSKIYNLGQIPSNDIKECVESFYASFRLSWYLGVTEIIQECNYDPLDINLQLRILNDISIDVQNNYYDNEELKKIYEMANNISKAPKFFQIRSRLIQQINTIRKSA